jgi:hypothetical protein
LAGVCAALLQIIIPIIVSFLMALIEKHMRHGYLMDMDLREGTLDIYLTSKLFCVK